jgi:hypothetical protein
MHVALLLGDALHHLTLVAAICTSIVILCSFFSVLPLTSSHATTSIQSAAEAAAEVIDGLFEARRLSCKLGTSTPKKSLPIDSPSACASAASTASSEVLADEMSLSLALLSKTISHAFAIIEQLPDADVDVDAGLHLAAAAHATTALQETMLRLADMYENSPALLLMLQQL